MLKTFNLVVAGTGESREVAVEANATVRDLLEQMGMSDFCLSEGEGNPPLPKDFNLSELPSNTTLYASTIPEAGNQYSVSERS